MTVLVPNNFSEESIALLTNANLNVLTTTVAQNQLENFINSNSINVLIVRNTVEISAQLIDSCQSLKLIGQIGTSMDNIAVEHAINKGLKVINTPNASVNSVAELVFAHLYSMTRFLHQANREMPLEGDVRFNDLKKQFSTGTELRGKTLGIIGFGRTGQAVAKIALGVGMRVIAHCSSIKTTTLTLPFYNGTSVNFEITTQPLNTVLSEADFISLHTPKQDNYLIGESEINHMKKGVGIINTSHGSVIDEVALIKAVETKNVTFAALDVFESEPKPEIQILMNPEISLSPHIAGTTLESQERSYLELAEQITHLLQ
ncbi:MAG: NAD(P)-dependent oxidoreductase [Flavobacteriaceae bacterium]